MADGLPLRFDDVPVFSAKLAATPAAAGWARHGLVRFAAENGADDDLQRRVALAVTEAVANVTCHAYPGPGTGTVILQADVLDGALEVVVTDEGTGLRTDAESEGLGLGLRFMVVACDDFSLLENSPSGTEVWMRFLLP